MRRNIEIVHFHIVNIAEDICKMPWGVKNFLDAPEKGREVPGKGQKKCVKSFS